jgi:exodeoxyribonuclease V alpha subunit
MDSAPEIPDYLRDRFPETGEDVLRLLAAAADNAGLLPADFYTIGDLLDLSEVTGPEMLLLLLCLHLALEEGSLCVEASFGGLERRLSDLTDETAAKTWAGRIVAALPSGVPNLIGTEVHGDKPVVLVSAGNTQFLYFQRFLVHESIFHDALRKRLDAKPPKADADRLRRITHEVLEQRPLRLDGQPLALDKRQRLALGLALLRDFAVVSGGPGTGKTSIVLTLLRCLVRNGYGAEGIALAAPTGRAAQRLTDALRLGLAGLDQADRAAEDETLANLTASTLHRLLHYSPTRGTFGRHSENTVPAKVIVVDEVSMVGVILMSQLLQATAPETKLILLGDKDQLPSVEAGAVLANLVPAGRAVGFSPQLRTDLGRIFGDLDVPSGPPRDFLVVLEENYRSQAQIRAAARAINQQDGGIVERLPPIPRADTPDADVLARLEQQGGCWFWPQTPGSVPELRRLVECWADHHYLAAAVRLGSYADLIKRCAVIKPAEEIPAGQGTDLDRVFQVLGRARLLTVVRDGPWGCVDLNRYLAQVLRPRWDRTGSTGLFAGAPVLITRNDYARRLFNGDVGVTLRSPDGGYRVVFPRQGGYVSFSADALPAHELGFALTVHKSQGSEYGQVLLVLPPQGARRLLTKEIIYTGITRAKQLAVIASTKEVLQFAVSRRIERDTGLSLRDTESSVR